MKQGLTTHVLDTAHGRPAAGVEIELYFLGEAGSERAFVRQMVTNEDGRLDEPMLSGAELQIGVYELVFHVGAYFKKLGVALPEPAFLGAVPVRVGIAAASAHYHVPLIITPWSYQVYRGS